MKGKDMRSRKLLKNTVSSLVLQIVTIVCGFVLPRLILASFGSAVNGLVNSINQFLHIIAFLDLGVGAVFQSSLYKPLADNDVISQSKIYVSGQRFFTRLAQLLLVYVAFLIAVYPFLIRKEFGFIYTATLIAAISISSFAQYYFGMANGLFLTADQKGYINYNVHTFTLILNTVLCFLLINMGASIHVVKLSTSCVYLIRPIVLSSYVNKHYNLDKKIKYTEEPIKQKWNGLAQHVAFVILDSTDTIVLSIFSTLQNVSIYSVYFLVISGIKQLFNATTNGIQALLGELYAREDKLKLNKVFGLTEWVLHTVTTIVFGCTYKLLVSFVLVYTKGITDADYKQPLFSGLLVLAYAMYCYRLPYHIIIKASGHYKQTQRCYFIAAILNISISILFVKWWGLIGVAIGTAIAMAYQTIWMVWYDSKNIIKWPVFNFLKQMCVNALITVVGILATKTFKINDYNYISWVLMAIIVSLIWGFVAIVVNCIFYKDNVEILFNKLLHKKSKGDN